MLSTGTKPSESGFVKSLIRSLSALKLSGRIPEPFIQSKQKNSGRKEEHRRQQSYRYTEKTAENNLHCSAADKRKVSAAGVTRPAGTRVSENSRIHYSAVRTILPWKQDAQDLRYRQEPSAGFLPPYGKCFGPFWKNISPLIYIFVPSGRVRTSSQETFSREVSGRGTGSRWGYSFSLLVMGGMKYTELSRISTVKV